MSLWQKIFGFTAVLLGLMLLVAAISFATSLYEIRLVRARVDNLSSRIIPLLNSVANIDAHALQQEIHLERVLRFYESRGNNAAAINKETKLFEALNERVDEELRESEKILEGALADEDGLQVEEAIRFSRLQPALREIEVQHQEYHDHALGVVAKLRSGRNGSLRALEERLAEEEEDLDARLEAVLIELEEFNKHQAEMIVAGEQRLFIVFLQNLAWTLLALITGAVVSAFVTSRIVRPVRALTERTEELAGGKLDVEVEITSEDEVGRLGAAFNHMAEELRQKERIKDTFGKYLDPRIVASLIDDEDRLGFEGERRVMTVFFSDVQKFSTISESLTPGGLVTLMNRYFSKVSEPIADENGVIDKYIGDAVMAFWGPPFTSEEEHARRACRATLKQFAALRELNASMADTMGMRTGLPQVRIRVGLATGELLAGNIGSDRSRSFTVMGDTVNIAARLESANKQYGTRILMAEATRNMIGEEFEVREIDNIIVVGKSEPVRIFQLLAEQGGLEADAAELRDVYEDALAEYREQNWSTAEARLKDCLKIKENDGPSRVLVKRVAHFQQMPPPTDWNGVWAMKGK